MRLIDADAFTKDLGLKNVGDGENVTLEDFDMQPTAYDVDKVVEQMEEIREEILEDTAYNNDTINHYLEYADLMIEDVKAGGIHE